LQVAPRRVVAPRLVVAVATGLHRVAIGLNRTGEDHD
jgi:hypothetical protein